MEQIDVSPALQSVRIERLVRASRGDIPPPCTTGLDSWPPNYDQVHAWRTKQLNRHQLDPSLEAKARLWYATRPVQFINHWVDTYDPRNANTGLPVWMPLILFPKQEELVRFVLACIEGEGSGIVEKSRDMGATWVCSGVSIWMWLFWRAVAIGWGSNNADKVDVLDNPDSVLEKMRLIIRRLPPVFQPRGVLEGNHLKQRNISNPENLSTIRGEINKQIGRGGRTRVYFVDEAAHLERPEMVEASLSENTRCRIDISSVSGMGTIFHRSREAGVEWRPGQPIHRDKPNVLIMDWRDHPAKTQQWYADRRAQFESRGLGHVIAREIDRDYAATVEGRIIDYAWIEASVDAHTKLGFDDVGAWCGALDVADGGTDTNALAKRKGVVLKSLAERGSRDVGQTARWAISDCKATLPMELQYDCIGIGAGVKAEANRLQDDDVLPDAIRLVPWNAGARVLNPSDRVVPGDEDSPTNREHFGNLKAQGWWELRMRFYRTFMAVTDGATFEPTELISLDSAGIGDLLQKLMKELAQVTATKNSQLRMIIDKTPEGTKSPNLGDATMMCYWPWSAPSVNEVEFFVPKIVQG